MSPPSRRRLVLILSASPPCRRRFLQVVPPLAVFGWPEGRRLRRRRCGAETPHHSTVTTTIHPTNNSQSVSHPSIHHCHHVTLGQRRHRRSSSHKVKVSPPGRRCPLPAGETAFPTQHYRASRGTKNPRPVHVHPAGMEPKTPAPIARRAGWLLGSISVLPASALVVPREAGTPRSPPRAQRGAEVLRA